jgi:predicted NBD/HSP70 family sugar kinase
MTINNDTSNVLALGMEIGGTKIQVGIGTTDGKILCSLVRRSVVREHGAPGIRRNLISMVDEALRDHQDWDWFWRSLKRSSRHHLEILSN